MSSRAIAGGDVPDVDGAIPRSGRQARAVVGEAQHCDLGGVS